MKMWRLLRRYFCVLALLAAGCGGTNNQSTPLAVNTIEAAAACIGCHSQNTSPGTGRIIKDEWLASAHNTASSANSTGFGASCRDCHEPESGHPNKCATCHGGVTAASATAHDVNRNPDVNRKCDKCHGPLVRAGLGLYSSGFRSGQAYRNHFNNITSLTLFGTDAAQKINYRYPAAYVSSASYASTRYTGNCRKCHNPHDPSTAMKLAREWSASPKAHGRPDGAWRFYDHKVTGGTDPLNPVPRQDWYGNDCVRCHTTTGFVNYVKSGFTDVRAWGRQSYQNPTAAAPNAQINNHKEMVGCDACHDNGNETAYAFGLRNVPPVTVNYNYQSGNYKANKVVAYKDLGPSNVCIACHTGRMPGSLLKDSTFANFTANLPYINPHFMAAGAFIYRSNTLQYAFQFYTSQDKYANYDFYGHNKIGLENYKNTGNKGPCLTCHMATKQHTFLPVDKDYGSNPLVAATPLDKGKISKIRSEKVCANCHVPDINSFFVELFPNGKYPWQPATLQYRKDGYFAARNALIELFKTRGIGFNFAAAYEIANPANTVINWAKPLNRSGANGNAARTLGSAMNANMLLHDDGAYAHNSLYTQRTIYDTIDWIYDGELDGDVKEAIESVTTLTQEQKDQALTYLFTMPVNVFMNKPNHVYDKTKSDNGGTDAQGRLINVRP